MKSKGFDSAFTRSVAELARLELSAEEINIYANQLSEIVGYVEQLQSLDVTAVAPLMNPLEPLTGSGASSMREDLALPSLLDSEQRPRGLEAAPETLNDGFKVPPII